MTREASSSSHGPGHVDLETEILAALWEDVPFPRIPRDAPPELTQLVVEIENPRRVYSIHRATRRHDLQRLVEKFIAQLRYGCSYDDCPTASCFSCRRRLAGKAPIRRYSPMSARTLAVYMATQDNPEQYLCPKLESKREHSDAIKPLIFGQKLRLPRGDFGEGGKMKNTDGGGSKLSVEQRSRLRRHLPARTEQPTIAPVLEVPRRSRHQRQESHEPVLDEQGTSPTYDSEAKISIHERPVRKDYRSFAANVFGTVAFKMLEWIAPNNLDAISDKAAAALENRSHMNGSAASSVAEASDDELFVTSTSSIDQEDSNTFARHSLHHDQDLTIPSSKVEQDSLVDTRHRSASLNGNLNGDSRPSHSRTNSNTRLRTSTKTKSLSTEQIPEVRLEGDLHRPVSPMSPTSAGSKPTMKLIKTSATITSIRPNERLTPDTPLELDLYSTSNGLERRNQETRQHGATSRVPPTSDGKQSAAADEYQTPAEPVSSEKDSDLVTDLDLPPQSLKRFNSETVDFLCDVLQQDGTAETHLFEPQIVFRPSKRPGSLKRHGRRTPGGKRYPLHLKLEWKLFIEQSLFSVLSNPRAILESFTTSDGLVDSHTLWYHMLRLTRTVPTLVFDSLWQASASLFVAPETLRLGHPSVGGVPLKRTRSLSNEEAGSLMAVCFHALVAAAPLVDDFTKLFDMSRIRSRGLILSESGPVARQPSVLCLQYEDAFTNDMAIRLARRLFAAISTRRCFDKLADQNLESGTAEHTTDVLDVILSHLEPGRETQSAATFSVTERETHEKRVPILLLDWARTIMLNEWQGTPDVPGDGPFGGAILLIAAMHQKRKSLLLGDAVFRIEYFGERLDSIEMPVSWLAFNSDAQKAHLLDMPYLFHHSSLVSYFRAINFSRMSRSYEESSSLQTRINAIIAMDSLVTDQHQKSVLQDLLKVASAKFLILDIGRKTVLQDAFDQLWRRQERELLRPLKVHLGEDTGEEGFDSGGVQQEFFRLAISEALNPDYGAFAVDDRTRMAWFQPGSLQPEWKFELVGMLISLAVFNGLTLPITFPKALYMKILDEPVTELHHIADGWPELASGLTTLLEWDESDGAVEDIFARTYEFSIDMFGQPVSRQMDSSRHASWPQFSTYPSDVPLTKDNPEDAPLVTGDNREGYVSDYIQYLTDVSVAPQFKAFARGFRACLNTKSLQLLNPPLLQSIVEGTQEIDIAELRRAARYVGWDASHRTVRDFWSIVKRYDDQLKRKLLEFVTASERVPVGGMRNVQFVVQRNGAEEGATGHLPTAYTCYGTLLLPEYRDKEVLRERLGMALENAQGFGFA